MTSDRYFGLAVVAVAGFYLVSSTSIPTGFLSDPVGSRTFPYVLGGIALLCGLLIAIRPDDPPQWPGAVMIVKLAIAAAVMYGFAETLRPLGFIIPSAIATAVLSYLILPDIIKSVCTGCGLSVGLFVVLKYGLGLGLSAF